MYIQMFPEITPQSVLSTASGPVEKLKIWPQPANAKASNMPTAKKHWKTRSTTPHLIWLARLSFQAVRLLV